MPKLQWNEITHEDVLKAIQIFDSEHPIYPEARSTYLLSNGKRYPAKHIRGMAYKVHFGQEVPKTDYSGGQETVRFFEKLGFKVNYTHQEVNTHPIKKLPPTTRSQRKAYQLSSQSQSIQRAARNQRFQFLQRVLLSKRTLCNCF